MASLTGVAGAAARLGRLVPSSTALFVCDLQERFRNNIQGFPSVVDTARRTIRGADALGLPVVVTEQYPKALGNTVPELLEVLPPAFGASPPSGHTSGSHHKLFQKTLFSMSGFSGQRSMTPEVSSHLSSLTNVKQVLLLGIEAHVCVLQTALDLVANGYEVHLLVDGVSSQREHDRAVALHRMMQAGVLLSTSEMALFQLAHDAKAPVFKAISALAKEPRQAHCVPLHSNL